jgi:hypothetical protein
VKFGKKNKLIVVETKRHVALPLIRTVAEPYGNQGAFYCLCTSIFSKFDALQLSDVNFEKVQRKIIVSQRLKDFSRMRSKHDIIEM